MINKLKQKYLRPRHQNILSMIGDNKSRLMIAMLFMLVDAATTAVSAYLIKPVLDDIFISKDHLMLSFIPVLVIVIFFFKGVAMYGHEFYMNYVGEGIIKRLRNRLYDKIQDLSLSFFHNEKTGVLMSRITNDVNVIKMMVSMVVTGSLRDVFKIIFLVGVIFYQIWDLAFMAMVVLPVAFYPIVVFGRRVRRVSTGVQESMAEMNSFLHETFAGNKIVKAFCTEEYEKQRFREKTQHLFRLEMKTVMAKALSSPVMEFLAGIGIAFIIWFGGSRVISGVYTAGTFISFLAAVMMLYDPVKKISRLNNSLQQGLAATDRVFDIIERESEIVNSKSPVEIIKGAHTVAFENVYFKYETDYILKNINLNVAKGEIIALVGMSGGGKTSMVNLIPRFYDVCEGAIKIDGTDIRQIRVNDLRQEIAIVTQEPILFNDTIKNNIAYGSPKATQEEIFQAAKAAYAYDFIMGFTKKFDTTIGELGSRLSGGEKQRICIARALLKNAPILLLDEATSALDAEAEQVVQKALENLMRGRTTFVIAHRLSTISYAKRIIVLVGGEIIEEGPHDELMAKKGEFYKLYQMQFNNGAV